MDSETLSQLSRFFPQLLDCICFSILAGWDIQRGSLCIIQKTSFFFSACCFSPVAFFFFSFLISICSYLCIKRLVCVANVSEWKQNECLQPFVSLTEHDFQTKTSAVRGDKNSSLYLLHSILISTYDTLLLWAFVCMSTILYFHRLRSLIHL